MKLWVGLGNPGTAYAQNRHNIGFMAVDRLAEAYSFSSWKKSGNTAICSGQIGMQKIILLKPLSFMNKSGLPVAETARFYKLPADQITIFYDEIDLDKGKLRIKQGGGHGGHNGVRDIDRHLDNHYWRVRIGVGRPDHKSDVHNWVLSDFSAQDRTDWLATLLTAITDEAGRLADDDQNGFASRLAFVAPAPKSQAPEQTD